jgi:hypothetical protein
MRVNFSNAQRYQMFSSLHRTYRLKKYTRCFVGVEAVQWLVNAGAAADDEEAVFLGNQMLQLGLLHHVKYKHPFKNRFLFYRYGACSCPALCVDCLIVVGCEGRTHVFGGSLKPEMYCRILRIVHGGSSRMGGSHHPCGSFSWVACDHICGMIVGMCISPPLQKCISSVLQSRLGYLILCASYFLVCRHPLSSACATPRVRLHYVICWTCKSTYGRSAQRCHEETPAV